MSFFQRTLQFFFLILGIIFVGTFILRWIAPDSRKALWQVLCPPNTQIEIVPGQAELEPGETVSAYEVVCVGEGIQAPLSDLQLLLMEMGTSLGLAVISAILFGWIATRKLKQSAPPLQQTHSQ